MELEMIVYSRYNQKRTIKCIDTKLGVFTMCGPSDMSRSSDLMFDFEGGPMLEVGEDFYGYGEIVGLHEKPYTKKDGVCVLVSVNLIIPTKVKKRKL